VAVDFQVVFPQQVIPLNSVRILPNMNPRSLDVIGADFSAVDEVLVNDIPSPDVVIVSKKRLLAQVPAAENFTAGTLGFAGVTFDRDDQFNRQAANNYVVK
jgi:hypothetical protein